MVRSLVVIGLVAWPVLAQHRSAPVAEVSVSGEIRTMLIYRDPDTFEEESEVELDREVRGLETIDGVLYGGAMVNGVHNLVVINPDTGATTAVGPTGIPGEPSTGAALAWDGNEARLYFSLASTLYLLDEETGDATQVGQYSFPIFDHMYTFAIDADGNAYGTDFGLIDQKANLYRINLADAALTDLGDLGYSNEYYTATSFGENGNLYGGRVGGEIWEIDIATVKDKFVVDGQVEYFNGWDFTPGGGGGGGNETLVAFEHDLQGQDRVVVRDGLTWDEKVERSTDGRCRGALVTGGMVFTTSMVGGVHTLCNVDLYTGEIFPIGPTGIGGEPASCSLGQDADGLCFLSTSSHLYIVDLQTGEAFEIGKYALPDLDKMYAFAIGEDDAAYGIDLGVVDHEADLYGIDLATGALQRLGDLGYSENYYSAMAFRSDGRLFGGRRNGDVWEVNVGLVTDQFVTVTDGMVQDGWSFGPVRCFADFTGDGVLDIFDFFAYVNAFNSGDKAADCVWDGVLDIFDFLCFLNSFNDNCPA